MPQVCRFTGDERFLHVDGVRRAAEGDPHLEAVEQRPEFRLEQVVKPVGQNRQPAGRGGKIGGRWRSFGCSGSEGVGMLPPFFEGAF